MDFWTNVPHGGRCWQWGRLCGGRAEGSRDTSVLTTLFCRELKCLKIKILYIYVCGYIYIHTHICVYIYLHTYTYVCIHIYTYTYVCIHIHTRVCVCVCVCMQEVSGGETHSKSPSQGLWGSVSQEPAIQFN